MKHRLFAASAIWLSVALSSPAFAQDHSGHDMGAMQHEPAAAQPVPPPLEETPPGQCPPGVMPGVYLTEEGNLWFEECRLSITNSESAVPINTFSPVEIRFERPGSGTSRLPGREGMMSGQHLMSGDWMFMVHGQASLQYTDHKGPRGDAMAYVTSMAMVTAERPTDWGGIRFSAMTSLEPAMDARGYPNLFATGETAGGLPLVDRQHPHDLFMELSARVDVNLGRGKLFLYGGPVGEPALGPSAFMHRGSAANNPEPPITHHWFDSTHITYGVVTLGYSAPKWQIEASAFRGREPDEDRWNIETPKLDSWSVRATVNPSPSWSLQASYGELKEPEALHPGEDEQRFTASLHYANAKGLSAMAAFSRKGHDGDNHNAWLGEANWDIDSRNSLFGRAENVDNSELFPNPLDPLHDEHFTVSKFQAGYARHVPLGAFDVSFGGSANFYAKPDALDAAYGDNPWGYTVFVRLKLGN